MKAADKKEVERLKNSIMASEYVKEKYPSVADQSEKCIAEAKAKIAELEDE